MYKLNIKNSGNKISYGKYSVNLKFIVQDKTFEKSITAIEKIFNIKITELQKKNFISDKIKEITLQNPNGKPDVIILSKVKIDNKFNADYFRNYLAGFIKELSKQEVKELHLNFPSYNLFKNYFESEEYFYQTFLEGIYFGNYTFDKYKEKRVSQSELNIVLHGNNKLINNVIKKTSSVMEGVYFARELENEPSNVLTPLELASRVKTKLSKEKVKVKIFDEKEIRKRKMGGLLAVGGGSENPPRFIILEYNGSPKKKKISLVGKGITFDSGGISIKPAQGMGEMKADMSGAAVVAGTILAAAKQKLAVNLIGIIPAAENMLSGKAFRPGDIVLTSSGKSIEIDNTDAEGRVILADALHYASQQKPELIIDLATLTGACVVALGEFVAGLFTKNDSVAEKLFQAGRKTNDLVWRMPLWEEYNYLIESEVADVKNLGGRWGGAITAAKFLEKFVAEPEKWVHLDIAGPSIQNNFNNYSKPFMTGFGVRLLFDFLEKEN